MLAAITEILGFLLFWGFDLLREIVYVVFRCRPHKQIRNENILITGTGSGIGKLIAERLAHDGNTLHCVDINPALNEETAVCLRNLDCTVYTYTCNVGELEGVRELWKQIRENTPDRHISYLFNIAGIVYGKLFAEESAEEMEKSIKVNLLGVMFLCKMAFEDMINNYGHIVNMSSTAGLMTGPRVGDYCASKFGVRGFSFALQDELRSLGVGHVKVTSVHPHITNTGMFNNTRAKWPIIPILEPQWVADEVIKATKEERDQVVLPKVINATLFPEHMMPMETYKRYGILLGNDQMKGFLKIREE